MTRMVALWFPRWPITAAYADEDTPEAVPGMPLALLHAGVVVAVSEQAEAEGVRRGQRKRDAHHSCPAVTLLPHQPERDHRLWATLTEHLSDVVPHLGMVEPGLAFLRARGIARYYGSEEEAARVLARAVSDGPVATSLRIGIADTLFAATQAAFLATVSRPLRIIAPGSDAEFLAPLPLSVLENPALASVLEGLGIATLGGFAALDEEQVRERFSPDVLTLHQLASGHDSRMHRVDDIPPGTDVVWRSDDPVETADQLAFSVVSSATAFCDGLRALHRVAAEVRISLVDDQGRTFSRVWSHPRFFQPTDIVHRMRWQLEALFGSKEGTEISGIVEVHCEAVSQNSLWAHEVGLYGGGDRDQAVAQAIARFQGRFGHQSVLHGVVTAGRNLADTHTLIAWGDRPPRSDTTPPDQNWAGSLPKPFPATVFSPPLPVFLHAEDGVAVAVSSPGAVLSAPPRWLVSPRAKRAVVAWAGPWPVMEAWWDPRRSRHTHRLQLMDEEGMGWLVSWDVARSEWLVEARYD